MNPWELAKAHSLLLAYTIESLREDYAQYEHRHSVLDGKRQALKNHHWQRSRLRRFIIGSAMREVQTQREQLEERYAEIVRWLPDLEAACARSHTCQTMTLGRQTSLSTAPLVRAS